MREKEEAGAKVNRESAAPGPRSAPDWAPEPDTVLEITTLLRAANRGETQALDRLVDLLYDELRWLAHRHLRREAARPLATTELVHEAYLKLAAGARLPEESRQHFLGAASRAMRQVLVSEARRRHAGKRSADGPLVPVELIAGRDPVEQILSVNGALEVLATIDRRLVQVVECRFFGGLSVEETAEVMATSTRTVKRDWRRARAWLYDRLGGTAGTGPV
jgi:RNA polymerase sigma factor (TIGR02999 family)